MIWHIFYNSSDKTIVWTANSGVNDSVIARETDAGLSYITVEQDDLVDASLCVVNSSEDGIALKATFTPTISTITPALESTVNITGLPVGTKVYINEVLKATMEDTTLNITFNDPGFFTLKLQKTDHLDYEQVITVGRYA